MEEMRGMVEIWTDLKHRVINLEGLQEMILYGGGFILFVLLVLMTVDEVATRKLKKQVEELKKQVEELEARLNEYERLSGLEKRVKDLEEGS